MMRSYFGEKRCWNLKIIGQVEMTVFLMLSNQNSNIILDFCKFLQKKQNKIKASNVEKRPGVCL